MACRGTALKPSQPRRSASLKSDRLILRMTNGLMMPTACGSGVTMLSEYGVAMAAASLAHGRSNENDAPQVPRIRPHVRKSRSSRVRQTEHKEKQLRRTKPVATCAVSLARLKQDSTHGWVNCASAKSFVALRHQRLVPTDARRLARS